MDEEMDILVFSDEDGNEIEYELHFTFEHKSREYAVLLEVAAAEQEDEGLQDLFLVEVVQKNGEEEFIAVEESEMDELTVRVEEIFAEEMENEENDGDDA